MAVNNLKTVMQFRRQLMKSVRAYGEFKSNISLERLYPNSRLDLSTIPVKPPENKDGKFNGFIPIDKIQVCYSRSSGPGGQNINCVSTKAEIRFHLASADWIPETIRTKFAETVKNQVNKDGVLVIKSERTRSQHLNLADALDKLRDMIRAAAAEPKVASQESIDRQTRLREKAARERLKEKRLHSMTKHGRQTSSNIDL
nr:EOG090X0JCO [Ilyocryptus agilis]